MNNIDSIKPSQLPDFLLQVSVHFPVFLWGPPGIGKSTIITDFAKSLDMECVVLVGQQILPEDLIGVPKIEGNVSKFCPPSQIVREKPFVLFLDEFNGASHEIQKAFLTLILNKQIGDYKLPKGSIIIAAGNRQQDSALVKNLPSPLINRMVHVELVPDSKDWIKWAYSQGIHESVIKYIENRPEHLYTDPPKIQEPFSTPRSWSMLGKLFSEYHPDELNEYVIRTLVKGSVSPKHAIQFISFHKIYQNKFAISSLLKGEIKWPTKPEERDLLYFMVQSFRNHLSKYLPESKDDLKGEAKDLAFKSKALISECAQISKENAQLILRKDDKYPLPNWFLIEVARDLPNLISKND